MGGFKRRGKHWARDNPSVLGVVSICGVHLFGDIYVVLVFVWYVVALSFRFVNVARCRLVKTAHAYALFLEDGARKQLREIVVCCDA